MAEESQEPNFYPKYRKVLPPGLEVNQVSSFSRHRSKSVSLILNCKKPDVYVEISLQSHSKITVQDIDRI